MKNKTIQHFTTGLLGGTLLLGLAGCGPAADEAPVIDLGYVLWDSEIASTHVVAAVIQDDLGYEVNLVDVDAGPMWIGIGQGNFDAIVAAWLPGTHAEYYDRYQDTIVDLGPNLEGAKIGWVVPQYVTIDSITELNANAEKFNNRVVGIDPGAGLMASSDEAFGIYDLTLDLLDSSDAAMTAELRSAYENEEWIVVTGWIPHWMFAAYDLKFLEDPENVFGDAESIHTIVSPDLAEKAPDVQAFLDAFNWSAEQMGEVMIKITQEDMEPYAAARAWIADNREIVDAWLL